MCTDTFAIFADPAYKTLVPYVPVADRTGSSVFLLELGDSQILLTDCLSRVKKI
jgi:hypothetical protein